MFLSLLGLVYTVCQHQCCNDASDTALIEDNEITAEWSGNPFSMDSVVFNESSIASIVAALTLMFSVNGPVCQLQETASCAANMKTIELTVKCFCYVTGEGEYNEHHV